MIYKTLHRKLKNEKHAPHKKLGVNSGAPEVLNEKCFTNCRFLGNNLKTVNNIRNLTGYK
jgi:hypothetical protein